MPPLGLGSERRIGAVRRRVAPRRLVGDVSLMLHELRTPRLLLRRWRAADRDPFAALNADPLVMEHFPALASRAESDALVDRIEAHFEERGFGPWAVEVPGELSLAGFVGLSVPRFEAPFTPCVEIGWRLAQASWGRGYATEAARAALAHGFDQVGIDEVVSFTFVGNERSRRVMERLGMRRDAEHDFEHPSLPAGHRLRPHVLYRLGREAWEAGRSREPSPGVLA